MPICIQAMSLSSYTFEQLICSLFVCEVSSLPCSSRSCVCELQGKEGAQNSLVTGDFFEVSRYNFFYLGYFHYPWLHIPSGSLVQKKACAY